MIPISVELSNFLSHRCKQDETITFDFEGARLWSISGDNGAGKSAIFDAITWTLYGRHRGGQQDQDKLICHGADRCKASFTFAHGDHRYRVTRTLRHGSSATRRAHVWSSDENGWREIDGTRSKGGLEAWVHSTIGLTYDTFVHSILLLQSGSDELIRRTPSERFDVLSTLLDLSEYHALAARAVERQRDAAARLATIDARRKDIPAVTDEERQAAQAELDGATGHHHAAVEAEQHCAALLAGARAHEDITNRLEEREAERARAQELTTDAAAIRDRAAEQATLADNRDRLERALTAIGSATRAETTAHQEQQRCDAIDLDARDRAAAEATAAAEGAEAQAQEARTSADALANVLPVLRVVVDQRMELEAAQADQQRCGTAAAAKQRLEACRAAAETATDALSTASEQRRAAEAADAAARATLDQAQTRLAERHDARDEATCSRCGLPVDEEHRAAELRAAEQALTAAGELATGAATELAAATAAEEQARQAVKAAGTEQTQAATTLTEAQAAEGRVTRAAEALQRVCADASLTGFEHPDRTVLLEGAAADAQDRLAALTAEHASAQAAAQRQQAAADNAAQVAATAVAAASTARDSKGTAAVAARDATAEAQRQRERAAILLEGMADDWVRRVQANDAVLLDEVDDRLAELVDAAAELAELEAAEDKLVAVGAVIAEVQGQLADLPDEHHVAVDSAEAYLAEAREARQLAERTLHDAEGELRDLDTREAERRGLEQRRADAAAQDRVATRLVVMLGRQGVQAYLLNQAAAALEQLANETLQKLSGGALQVLIRSRERRNRDELAIVARDLATGNDIEAVFLSGSEKFRVCVAVAAAIGKYIGGMNAISSLIIDEGLGSLDETGRDAMIDELRHLSTLLERVIVVSHQSDFYDRTLFPHGYVLRRGADGTLVERYV